MMKVERILRFRDEMHPKLSIASASIVNQVIRVSQTSTTGIDIVVAMVRTIHNFSIGIIHNESLGVVTNYADDVTRCSKVTMYYCWISLSYPLFHSLKAGSLSEAISAAISFHNLD
jgi:hypothetical protein